MNEFFSEDRTFCMEDNCENMDCIRNKKHIADRTIPHSYSKFKHTIDCPNSSMEILYKILDMVDMPTKSATIKKSDIMDVLYNRKER